MKKKVLAFRLWGDYAHFKRYYTTTSPLTFEIPPPPTVVGIISAILGYDKNEYLKKFADAANFKIAIKIDNPIEKVRWGINLADTKRNFSLNAINKNHGYVIENRTQIRTEFLRNPAWTIYFYDKRPEVYETFKTMLQEHQTVYSVSLGLAGLLADFAFENEYEAVSCSQSETEKQKIAMASVVLQDNLWDNCPTIEPEKEILLSEYPLQMMPGRTVTRRGFIYYERQGKTLTCMPREWEQLGDGKYISWL